MIVDEECGSLHSLDVEDLTLVDEWERNLFHGSEWGSCQKKTWGPSLGTSMLNGGGTTGS